MEEVCEKDLAGCPMFYKHVAVGDPAEEILKAIEKEGVDVVVMATQEGHILTGCCPNQSSFERSLKRFLVINLGKAEDVRFQLFEPGGRVLESPGASHRFIKKRFRPSEKQFGQQPVNY